MESWQNLLQKMGSNFIVASFVPSMAFVVFSAAAFLPIMPDSFQDYWGKFNNSLGETTLILLLFTTLLGFTLFTLSTFIYKSFEGYTFLFSPSTFLGQSGLRRQKKRVKEIQAKRRRIERALLRTQDQIDILNKRKHKTGRDIKRQYRYEQTQNRLQGQKYALIASYNLNFPSQELILSTRFGNILRAAETYPGTRYGIDAVELWPRLAHVIPPEGMTLIDNAHNECLFLLNSSLLATLASVLSFFAAAYRYTLHEYSQSWLYLIVGIIAIGSAWFFYEASLLNVGHFGAMIRSAYDLYRFRLIDALSLPLPKTLSQEIEIWNKLSNFYSVDHEFNERIDFNYLHGKGKNKG